MGECAANDTTDGNDNNTTKDTPDQPENDNEKVQNDINESEEKNEDKVNITTVAMEDKGAYYLISNNLDPEIDRDVVSILALSDTASAHSLEMMQGIPPSDILIHAGNFTANGTEEEVKAFNEWINKLIDNKQCKEALVIAGNHEIAFDDEYKDRIEKIKIDMNEHSDKVTLEGISEQNEDTNDNDLDNENDEEGVDKDDNIMITATNKKMEKVEKIKYLIQNAVYLEDSAIEILGVKFYGTPWSRLNDGDYNDKYKAFTVGTEEELKKIYDNIPYEVDVMISHYPCYRHGDGADNVGSKALINKLMMDTQPMFFVSGHVCSGFGATKQADMNCVFMNVNCSNEESQMERKPVMFYVQPKFGSFF